MSITTKSHRDLVGLLKKIVPPLLPTFHKGQAGRVVVIGGCEDYTGAPYFSAHAALLFGCDLSHIICEQRAATVIKSYSPNLMVHPYLYETSTITQGLSSSAEDIENYKRNALEKSKSVLSRGIHCVVVGPGLGRDTLLLDIVEELIVFIKSKSIPLVLDADSLYIINQNPELIKGYSNCVLTPNVMEFKRLAAALGIDLPAEYPSQDLETLKQETIEVSKALGNVIILRKGPTDIIVQGDKVLTNSTEGSNRRVGGQGDSLTGVLSTLISWTKAYKDDLWKHGHEIADDELQLLASYGACTVVRTAAKIAFAENGRAMQTTDLQAAIAKAYKAVLED